ncbi:MAG: hypothetical protein COA77_07335 [Thaumarchaeota archaeon]|nr:MAG: hypothetical protein COA77_07335 [Nitrososphaerota archaeon]
MQKQLTFKINLKSTLDVNVYLQLENKCQKLFSNDEIRFVGVINNMGNLIAGGFSKCVDLIETDEERRKLYMQMTLEISMRKDFDDTLGTINYITTNRSNVLMITIPLHDHVILISAKHTSTVEQIGSDVCALKFFESET